MDKVYQHMRKAVVGEIVAAVMHHGQGCLFLQLDGVKTKRGDCEPVLVSWIDPKTFMRKTALIGVGYESGKGAANSADNLRAIIKELCIVEALESWTKNKEIPRSPASIHFVRTYNAFVDEFQTVKKMSESEAAVAAVASYCFGSATTDGAILGLLNKISGGVDEQAAAANAANKELTTTHWCSAHRLSLTAKLAFQALKTDEPGAIRQHRSIHPPDKQWATAMVDFLSVVHNLVKYYSETKAYARLIDLAGSRMKPRKMYAPTPTRFNAHADLLLAVHHNMILFEEMYDEMSDNCPVEVADLFMEHQIGSLRFTVKAELAKMVPILHRLRTLSKLVEGVDTDACVYEWAISTLALQLDGVKQMNFEADEGPPCMINACTTGSALLPGLVKNLQLGLGYYMDLELNHDWALLLCIILHPASSGGKIERIHGQPQLTGTEWRCLKGRFKHVYVKTAGGWDHKDNAVMAMQIMAAGQHVLQQELEAQYDIEHPPQPAAEIMMMSTSSSTGPASKRPPGSACNYIADDSDDEEEIGGQPPTSRQQYVQQEMDWWQSRSPNKKGTLTSSGRLMTMLEFWKEQGDRPLRRLAFRVGALQLSQAGTERSNKVPGEIWQPDRRSLTPLHMARDLFIYLNREFFPQADFDWTKESHK